MTKHYIATVPVTYTDERGTEKTSFRRVARFWTGSSRKS